MRFESLSDSGPSYSIHIEKLRGEGGAAVKHCMQATVREEGRRGKGAVDGIS